MRIQLNIEYILINEPDNYLKYPDNCIRPLLECLTKLPFWHLIKYFGKWGNKNLKEIKDIDKLIKDSAFWKNGSYILASENEVVPMVGIAISPSSTLFGLKILVGEPFLSKCRETILDDLIEFTKSVYKTFNKIAMLGPSMGIIVHGIEYPRPRPPHLDSIWEPSIVVDFASTQFHNQSKDGNEEQFNKIKQAVLPKTTIKLEFQDLLIIKWIDNLKDSDKIAAALSKREKWFSENMKLSIDGSFNEAGDKFESYEILEKHKYLTFVDTFTKIGYKAVVVNPDGSVDEELFTEMAKWISNSSTPDGTQIKQLILITPDRESALKIFKKSKRIGVDKVLYIDKDDSWWDPNPPGLWIE